MKLWYIILVTSAKCMLITAVYHRVHIAGNEEKKDAQSFPAEEGVFTWMVSLFIKMKHVCSGSLISDRLVLTAAHCIKKNGTTLKPQDFQGHFTTAERGIPDHIFHFEAVHVHPKYHVRKNGEIDFDVAVMVTNKNKTVKFNRNRTKICLSSEEEGTIDYGPVISMGWGRRKGNYRLPGEPLPPPDRVHYNLPKVMKNSHCSHIDKHHTDSTICTTDFFPGVRSRDSGGPLVAFSSRGEPVQVGIESYRCRNGNCKNQAIFARVAYFTEFIEGIAEDYNSTLCFRKPKLLKY